MAISPLSEQSIAAGSHPVNFPDFTNGRWMYNKPIFGLTDDRTGTGALPATPVSSGIVVLR